MRLLLILGVVTWHVTSFNVMAAPPEKTPTESTMKVAALESLATSVNTFSTNLFKVIASSTPGNLICAPISASMVLSMATFGAKGNTEKQLRSALALNSNDELTKTGVRSLVDSFANIKNVELRLANKIFYAKGFQPKAEFSGVTENSFRSKVQSLDFSKPAEASSTINTWCEDQTNKRIKDLIQPEDLNAQTALVLVNAVYFKGNWAEKFDASKTEAKPFHVDKSTVKNVPTMTRQGSYRYGELPEVKATFVELPYAHKDSSESVSMFIILPNEIDGLAALEKNLEKVTVEKLLRGTSRDVIVSLPKFKIESTINLEAPLQQLGLTDMFTDHADFTGIVDSPPLKVSKVIQKAFIEVNEEGSEAAAATALGIVALSLSFDPEPQLPIEFNVNRPAHFFITAKLSQGDVTLFKGSLEDPIID